MAVYTMTQQQNTHDALKGGSGCRMIVRYALLIRWWWSERERQRESTQILSGCTNNNEEEADKYLNYI